MKMSALALAAALVAGSAAAQAPGVPPLDTNHDGRISAAGFQAGRTARFRTLDANGDGLLDHAGQSNWRTPVGF